MYIYILDVYRCLSLVHLVPPRSWLRTGHIGQHWYDLAVILSLSLCNVFVWRSLFLLQYILVPPRSIYNYYVPCACTFKPAQACFVQLYRTNIPIIFWDVASQRTRKHVSASLEWKPSLKHSLRLHKSSYLFGCSLFMGVSFGRFESMFTVYKRIPRWLAHFYF